MEKATTRLSTDAASAYVRPAFAARWMRWLDQFASQAVKMTMKSA